jgi:hypothetical protein
MAATAAALAQLDTFGFCVLRGAIPAHELAEFTTTFDCATATAHQDGAAGDLRTATFASAAARFAEHIPELAPLFCNAALLPLLGQYMGPGYVFVGSEGVVTDTDGGGAPTWHSDRTHTGGGRRPEDDARYWEWRRPPPSYRQLKAMVYLDRVTTERGALRIVSGSHREPLHSTLAGHCFTAPVESLPGVPLESTPGDIVLFDHFAFHSVFGGFKGRRYIALKWAADPAGCARQLDCLYHNGGGDVFDGGSPLLRHPHPAVRAMAERTAAIGDTPQVRAEIERRALRRPALARV